MREYNRTELTKLKGCNDCILVGKLAVECQYPIGVMSNSSDKNVFFNIKPICDEPMPVVEFLNNEMDNEEKNNNYLGIDIYQWEIMDDNYYDLEPQEKMKFIEEKLENKIILFTPAINVKNYNMEKKLYKNLRIVSIEEDGAFSDLDYYESYVTINNFNSVFEEQILSKKPINICDYSLYMPNLKYLLCGEYLYYGFSAWKQDRRSSMLIHVGESSIKKVKIEDLVTFKNNSILAKGDHSFIKRGLIENLILSGEPETVIKSIDNSKEISQSSSIKREERLHYDILKDCDSEIEFLQELKRYTIAEGLCYDFSDLVNFHISLKTNPLTILAGMAGMGKTQLALSYARAFGLNQEDRVLIVPISPSYTEPSDILGYLNNSKGSYIPSETGVVEFLVQANKNKDKMYMIIFDEMNLSQIEHWFAPFISLLELNERDRNLRLYSSKSQCNNKDHYPSSVLIGNNILFVGTVNMDETTKEFSDRLLDRANIITPKKKSFLQYKKEQQEVKTLAHNNEEYGFYDSYMEWVDDCNGLEAFNEESLRFLDELHELIQSYDEQRGISFRTVESIGKYLKNIPFDANYVPLISMDDAFDIQIKQRVLTKIRGTREQFGDLIGQCEPMQHIPENSQLYELFNSEIASNISSFKITKKEICRKARELSLYGYTN